MNFISCSVCKYVIIKYLETLEDLSFVFFLYKFSMLLSESKCKYLEKKISFRKTINFEYVQIFAYYRSI